MATYYAALSGSAGNNGTSSGTPWNFSKAMSQINSLSGGDSMLFNGGDVFPGWTTTLTANGSAGNPITFGSYGTGQAIFNGFTTISAWTSLGGGLYESTSSVSALGSCVMVTFNGNQQGPGRFPTAGATNGGYLTATSVTGNTSSGTVSSATTLPSTFAGGTLVARTEHWRLDNSTISSCSGGTVSYGAISTVPQVGFGFFIQNHVDCCTTLGDWYFDSGTGKLTMYFGVNSPGSYTIQIASTDTFVTANANYITFNGLTFTGCNTDGIASTAGKSNLTVEYCNFTFIGNMAVHTAAMTSATISNNSIQYCNSAGIYGTYTCSNFTVLTNIVDSIGLVAGLSGSATGGTGMGIFVTADSSTMSANKVSNCGYIGINWNNGNNSCTVQYNVVHDCCSVADDGGCIYSINIAGATVTDNLIDHNEVYNAIGNNYGTNNAGAAEAHGIYFDKNSTSQYFTCSNNTCYSNAYSGIYMHNNNHASITGNTLYNNGFTQMFFQYTSAIAGITFTGNIMYALSGQYTFYFDGYTVSSDQIPGMGTLNGNAYCRPSGETNSIDNRYNSTNHLFSFSGWKSTYTIESTGGITPTNLGGTESFYTNPPTGGGSLSGTWTDMLGNSKSGSFTIASYESLLILQTSTSGGSVITMPIMVKLI